MPASAVVMSQIQETAARLRKAIERENDVEEFAVEFPLHTNRGNKLKRKAEACREGQLGGQRPFKKRIDHAGHERYILHSNPKRYDEDGYELDPEDEDPEADEAAAEENPYHLVHIQDLLMPLTAASELDNHPTLSLPYKSKVLPDMVRQACNMIRKERRALVELKSVLTKFRGDHHWVPCGAIFNETDADIFLTDILPEHVDRIQVERPKDRDQTCVEAQVLTPSDPQGTLTKSNLNTSNREPASSVSAELAPKAGMGLDDGHDTKAHNNLSSRSATLQDDKIPPNDVQSKDNTPTMAGNVTNSPRSNNGTLPATSHSDEDATNDRSAAQEKSSSPHTGRDIPMPDLSPRPRMLTRHQAQARASSQSQPNGLSLESASSPVASTTALPPIHPLYTIPTSALPDRNFGLPEPEADDTRRVLSALVQKQEEVVRSAAQLYEGLLKANRLAQLVWRSCRAEPHVDEMSDGEDWVDLDEWGLDTPLKKGNEEGEADGDGGGGGGARQGVSAKDGTGAGGGTGTSAGEKRGARGRKGAQ